MRPSFTGHAREYAAPEETVMQTSETVLAKMLAHDPEAAPAWSKEQIYRELEAFAEATFPALPTAQAVAKSLELRKGQRLHELYSQARPARVQKAQPQSARDRIWGQIVKAAQPLRQAQPGLSSERAIELLLRREPHWLDLYYSAPE
jgi:hypothetical protein